MTPVRALKPRLMPNHWLAKTEVKKELFGRWQRELAYRFVVSGNVGKSIAARVTIRWSHAE